MLSVKSNLRAITVAILYIVTILFCCEVKLTSSAIVIVTWNKTFHQAVDNAANDLSIGKSCLDAIVTACRTCQDLGCDGTVGAGGSPDEAGETTLDAMIMDGTTMNIGAVGALRKVKDAIGVARKVLENTKHTLLVGDQATDFAIKMGFQEESLTSKKSKDMWKKWHNRKCQPNFWTNVKPDPKTSCGPYKALNFLEKVGSSMFVDEQNHDTIGVVAIDIKGDIAAGTSTNGANHKIPGRVGDSPIPGAGAYATQGIGAAAATGDGDIMMRFLPSFLAVEGLRQGLTPKESAENAIKRMSKYYPDFSGAVIVLSSNEQYAAACHGMEYFPYVVGDVEEGSFTSFVEKVDCI